MSGYHQFLKFTNEETEVQKQLKDESTSCSTDVHSQETFIADLARAGVCVKTDTHDVESRGF